MNRQGTFGVDPSQQVLPTVQRPIQNAQQGEWLVEYRSKLDIKSCKPWVDGRGMRRAKPESRFGGGGPVPL